MIRNWLESVLDYSFTCTRERPGIRNLFTVGANTRRYKIKLLKQIKPYIKLKSRQLDLSLLFLSNMEKNILKGRARTIGHSKSVLVTREKYYKRMKYLNQNPL